MHLNQLGYIGGDSIEGELSLNLEESFPGHILQVSLMGIEKTRYKDKITSGMRKGGHRHVRGLNKFLDYVMPVYDFALGGSGGLSPGQWSIPFKLNTTPQLPSSINYSTTVYTACDL